MSQVIIEDAGWEAIMADPKLQHARSKLSFHEIRLLIRHARARDRAALLTIRELLADDAGEPSLSGHAFMIADAAICPSDPPQGPVSAHTGDHQAQGRGR